MGKGWFEVDTEGLRVLQEGKPKHFLVRELVQNAWDEDTKSCRVTIRRDKDGRSLIAVEDDNPTGFKDLVDSFTLFRATSKQQDPTKRGRFNLGEKQAIAVAEFATIETTKGTVRFDAEGRKHLDVKRKTGSKVTIAVTLNDEEHAEILAMLKVYLPPKQIDFTVNGKPIPARKPRWSFDQDLPTVRAEKGGGLKATHRVTTVDVLENGQQAYLYELGIPVCEIDCPYSLDVQQKIPLSPDRESVTPKYIALLYAHTLNATYADLTEEECAENWVKLAVAHPHVKPEAVKTWVQRSYGDKVVVANPRDRASIDEAVAKGYRVVYGTEISKDTWKNIKEADKVFADDGGVMPSSTEMFGQDPVVTAKEVEVTGAMQRVAKLAKKIAKRCLHIEIAVSFKTWESGVIAQFGHKHLTFNVGNLRETWFEEPVSAKVIDLIVHELAHHEGLHTESGYHDAMTMLAGELVMIALREPDFFEV